MTCNVVCFQVPDTGHNNCVNVSEVYLLCKRHADGRAMGKEGCIHILLGAYPRLAPLDIVHVFLSCDFCVSNLSSKYFCFLYTSSNIISTSSFLCHGVY